MPIDEKRLSKQKEKEDRKAIKAGAKAGRRKRKQTKKAYQREIKQRMWVGPGIKYQLDKPIEEMSREEKEEAFRDMNAEKLLRLQMRNRELNSWLPNAKRSDRQLILRKIENNKQEINAAMELDKQIQGDLSLVEKRTEGQLEVEGKRQEGAAARAQGEIQAGLDAESAEFNLEFMREVEEQMKGADMDLAEATATVWERRAGKKNAEHMANLLESQTAEGEITRENFRNVVRHYLPGMQLLEQPEFDARWQVTTGAGQSYPDRTFSNVAQALQLPPEKAFELGDALDAVIARNFPSVSMQVESFDEAQIQALATQGARAMYNLSDDERNALFGNEVPEGALIRLLGKGPAATETDKMAIDRVYRKAQLKEWGGITSGSQMLAVAVNSVLRGEDYDDFEKLMFDYAHLYPEHAKAIGAKINSKVLEGFYSFAQDQKEQLNEQSPGLRDVWQGMSIPLAVDGGTPMTKGLTNGLIGLLVDSLREEKLRVDMLKSMQLRGDPGLYPALGLILQEAYSEEGTTGVNPDPLLIPPN